jgi:hypothetical protein
MQNDLAEFFEPRPRPKRNAGHLRILALVGGCRGPLAPWLDMYDPDFALIADVRRDLDQLVLPPDLEIPVAMFALGRGETVDTLMAEAPDAQRLAARQLPGVITDGGLIQVPQIAYYAGRKLIRTPDFEEFSRRLLGHLRITSGGRPELLEILAKGSVAGATNAGAAIPIIDELRRQALRLSVPVETRYDLTGSATFAGVDKRGNLNVAVSVPHFIAQTLRKGQDAELRATAKVSLVELPPTFIDREARSRFVLADEAAQASSELERELATGDPNETLVTKMGAVSIREADFGQHLDPETEIVPPIAKAYYVKVRQALDRARPCRSLVSEIDSRRHAARRLRESAEEIVARSLSAEPAELLDALQQPAEDIYYDLTLKMAGDQEYRLDRYETYFAQPAKTLTESAERLRLIRSQQASLQDELASINDHCAQLRGQLSALEDDFLELWEQFHKISQYRGYFGRRKSPDKARQALAEVSAEYRQLHDELLDCQALQSALSAGERAVSTEERTLSAELKQLAATLDQHILRGMADHGQKFVMPRPIDAAYGELRNLPRLPLEIQRQLLASHAGAVTTAGLARILRAPVPRAETIVELLLAGKLPVIGPPWAGKSRQDTPQVVLVLPTMKPADADAIRQLIANRDKRQLVVFTDSIRAVVNVVRYRLYRVNKLEELYPECLCQELLDARTGPLAAIYDVENCPVLKQMGIVIENDRVRFTGNINLE